MLLPAAGTWCYRPYLGAADLLGANPAPRFTTQVAVGSGENFTFAVFGDWGQVDADGNNVVSPGDTLTICLFGKRSAGWPLTSCTNMPCKCMGCAIMVSLTNVSFTRSPNFRSIGAA